MKTHNAKSILKLWKDKDVEKIEMKFACGGDSMNDTDFTVYLKNGETESDGELVSYFDNEVYNHIEFYVNSDGHYEGEAGTVEITLDGEEGTFIYLKSALSEWNESDTITFNVKLNQKEATFLKDHVQNINGSENDLEMTFNYKHDLILNDEMEGIVEKIQEKIDNGITEARHGLDIDDLHDWYNFTTNETGGLELKKNELKIILNYSYSEWKDAD